MGFGNIGVFQILIVLVIVLLVFGTKKIRTLGGDLGGAIRDFRKGVSEDPDAAKSETDDESAAADASAGGKSTDSDKAKDA